MIPKLLQNLSELFSLGLRSKWIQLSTQMKTALGDFGAILGFRQLSPPPPLPSSSKHHLRECFWTTLQNRSRDVKNLNHGALKLFWQFVGPKTLLTHLTVFYSTKSSVISFCIKALRVSPETQPKTLKDFNFSMTTAHEGLQSSPLLGEKRILKGSLES